jgi:hypothetical protein
MELFVIKKQFFFYKVDIMLKKHFLMLDLCTHVQNNDIYGFLNISGKKMFNLS